MYKISVPIAVESISDEFLENDLNKYLAYFQKGKIDRVFISLLNGMYTKEADQVTASKKFQRAVRFFKEHGMEVGVWLSGFGHGAVLSHNESDVIRKDYQQMTGVMGESLPHGYCPLDEDFTNDYLNVIRTVASYSPDIIMLDDDFRMNGRGYTLGCFCPAHLKEFYRLVGEEIPRENIEKLIFTGGKNKYRDAYMEMSKNTLLDFAKKVRSAVDEIDSTIRVGACMVFPTWDFEGTDGIEIAKTFAGSTKPFIRGIGAPYHNGQLVIPAIENERLQAHWVRSSGEDIEFFDEGDVYPRPRYNVPSKLLELFNLALYCSGQSDGILKYMFDYTQRVGYESGYIDRHTQNLALRESVKALFKDKKTTGVHVYGAMHKIRNFVFSETLEPELVHKFEHACKSQASYVLSRNSIPTCYEPSEYPVAVFGESARYIDKEDLKHGAILDSRSAKILAERGIDTGLLTAEKMPDCMGEYYFDAKDTISNFTICIFPECHIQKMVCKENVKIESVILPENTPGSYTYENEEGLKFMVIAGDLEYDTLEYGDIANANYYNNYYRQKQLFDNIEYLCGKKLPAICEKNPNLYVLAAKNDRATSVLMMNIFTDDVIDPVVTLDKAYKRVKFVNCNGELKGDKLYLQDIPAYGFAAFEVEE